MSRADRAFAWREIRESARVATACAAMSALAAWDTLRLTAGWAVTHALCWWDERRDG